MFTLEGVNLEWNLSEFGANSCIFTHFLSDLRIMQRSSSDPWGHSKKSENTKFHLNFTLNSLFSEIYSLESEHFHSLFLESRYPWINWLELVTRFQLQKSESSTDNDPHLVILIIKCKMKYISLSQKNYAHSFESAQ